MGICCRCSQDSTDKNENLLRFTQLCCNIRLNNSFHAFPVFLSQFLYIFLYQAHFVFLYEVKKVTYKIAGKHREILTYRYNKSIVLSKRRHMMGNQLKIISEYKLVLIHTYFYFNLSSFLHCSCRCIGFN